MLVHYRTSSQVTVAYLDMLMITPSSSPFSPIYHESLTDLELDIKHISDCMHQNHLKMNNGKTEFITFGTRSCLQKQYLSEITVGNDVVKGSETIRFLGIIMDKELDMKKFVVAKARTA